MDNNNLMDGLDRTQRTTIGEELANYNGISQDSVVNNFQFANKLFLSLKSHIDYQCKLNHYHQCQVRSFERFRKYCERIIYFDDGTLADRYDAEQFRNEYNKFNRNYRYWRIKIQKLRSMSTGYQNLYDTLYELFVKIETFDQSINKNSEDPSSINSFGNCNVDNRSTQDQSIQCDFKVVFDGQLATKRSRGRPRKIIDTRSAIDIHESLSADLIYPNTSLNVIDQSTLSINCLENIPVNSKISVEDNESLNDFSDSSYDISMKDNSGRGRKQTTKTKKSTASKQSAKNERNLTNQETTSDSDWLNYPKKKIRGRTKSANGPRVHQCEDCQYSTTSLSSLKVHRRTHTNERPFKCDRCDSAFTVNKELKRHRDMHDGVRFHCTFEGCTASYSMKRRVQEHIKIVHTKEAPLLHCDWEGCQYSTYQSNCLRTHRKIHTGQRQYKCPHCEMAFNSQSNLWGHKLKHENIGGFKCDFEGCQFSTHRKSMFQNHQRTHSEERLFSCAWPGCGDSFKTPTGLGCHKLIHENLRRYKCTWDGCSYASNVPTGLRNHIEGVHEKIRKPRAKRNQRTKTNLLDSQSSQRLESLVFE